MNPVGIQGGTCRQQNSYGATMKTLALVFLLGASFCVSSCDTNRVYEKNETIDKYIWDSKFIPSFAVEVKDTTVKYNLYVNIRHAEIYPYRNIWLLVGTHFPDGNTTSSRIEVTLAADDGKWYGEGMGDIWDYRSLISENMIFRKPGTYTFTLQQNMREDLLPGIMSVGIRLENSGAPNVH